jgi:hypothetical protein
MEQQPSGRITRIDLLVEDVEAHLLAFKRLGDLTQMPGRACQPVQAGDDERIALPHIFQARVEPGPLAGSAAGLLLKDFVAVLELVELHVEVLPDRTHPRIAHKRHSVSPTVF